MLNSQTFYGPIMIHSYNMDKYALYTYLKFLRGCTYFKIIKNILSYRIHTYYYYILTIFYHLQCTHVPHALILAVRENRIVLILNKILT